MIFPARTIGFSFALKDPNPIGVPSARQSGSRQRGAVQTQSVLSQSSYVSQNDFRLHFGLGSATRVDRISVRWPSGTTEQFPAVPADGLVLLVEGSGTVKRLRDVNRHVPENACLVQLAHLCPMHIVNN